MNGILFPSISLPLPDRDLIPAVLIIKKSHEENTSPRGTYTHTHTRMCTRLALKCYVAIYELAISGASQYPCMTQPGGTG